MKLAFPHIALCLILAVATALKQDDDVSHADLVAALFEEDGQSNQEQQQSVSVEKMSEEQQQQQDMSAYNYFHDGADEGENNVHVERMIFQSHAALNPEDDDLLELLEREENWDALADALEAAGEDSDALKAPEKFFAGEVAQEDLDQGFTEFGEESNFEYADLTEEERALVEQDSVPTDFDLDELFDFDLSDLEAADEKFSEPTPNVVNPSGEGDGLNFWGGVQDTSVILQPGDGWTEFVFNTTGTNATASFYAFSSTKNLTLYVQDFGCAGDQFAIYDNGVLIGTSSAVATNNCSVVYGFPSDAYLDPAYSTFSATLEANVAHNIVINALASPYMLGTGAIQVNLDLDVCQTIYSNYTLVLDTMAHEDIAAGCASIGMEPLDVNIYNFMNINGLIFNCTGPYSHAYIGSYWGNTYMGSPLAQWVADSDFGGSIAPVVNGSVPLPFICQEISYFDQVA